MNVRADNMHVKLIIIHIRLPYHHPFETMLPVAAGNFPMKNLNEGLELMTLPYTDDVTIYL